MSTIEMIALMAAGSIAVAAFFMAITANEIRRSIPMQSEQEEPDDDNYFAGR